MVEEFKDPADYLEYIPAPEKPYGFDERWLKIVGISPNQIDPYVRFIWGMDAKEQYGDKLLPRYPDPDDKYVGLPFWVLEGWQSPEVYDPVEWEAKKDVLGEFPRNGVWDFIEVYRTEDYRFIPLGEGAFKKAYEWQMWKTKPKKRAVQDLLDYRQRIADLKEQRWERKKQEIYADFVEEYSRAEAAGEKNAAFSFSSKVLKPDELEKISGFKRTESGLIVPNN